MTERCSLCWSQWFKDKDKQIFFHDAPRLVLEGSPDRLCTEQILYETISGDIRWRWSLVVPDDNKPLGKKSLAIKFHHPKASISLSVQPLVFSEPRLSEMVEKVQRRSLEAGGDFSAVKSLKQLREVIAKRNQGFPAVDCWMPTSRLCRFLCSRSRRRIPDRLVADQGFPVQDIRGIAGNLKTRR